MAKGDKVEKVLPPLPEARALRNPQPVRDFARGLSFEALKRVALLLRDPDTKPDILVKATEMLLKYGIGQPSMAEIVAAASDSEIQEAKALGLLDQALRDPAVRAWAVKHKPELIRAAAVVEEVVAPVGEVIAVGEDVSA